MATDGVRVETAEVERLLEDAGGRLTDLRVPFGIFNKGFERFEDQQFRTAGARGGERWRPLAPSTKARRLSTRGGNRGGVDRPLWDFGRLKASLSKGGPESIKVIEKMRYERGTSVPYAVYHQLGFTVQKRAAATNLRSGLTRRTGSLTGRRVPARPLIPERMLPIWAKQAEVLIVKHVEAADGSP